MTAEVAQYIVVGFALGFLGGVVAGVSILKVKLSDLSRQIFTLADATQKRRRRYRRIA